MQRAHRSVMTGVHRLKQIEGFRSAHLADDDAFWPHAQTVFDQVTHRDLADALKIRRTRFKPHDMRLLQLELGRVLASDDSLIEVDIVRQAIQERGLAGARAAGDDDVATDVANDLEDFRAGRRDRAELDQLIERQLVLLKLADRQCSAIDRERRRNDVDARAIEKAGVVNRRGFVDSTSNLTDDPLANVHQLRRVAETDVGELDLAPDFDETSRWPIDHDVGDVVASEQRLKRTETQNIVADVIEQVFLLGDRQHQILDGDDLVDDVPNFLTRAVGVELGECGEIDRLDKSAEDQRLGLEIGFRSSFGVNRRGRRRRSLGLLTGDAPGRDAWPADR